MIFSRDKTENQTVVSLIASALRRDISFGDLHPDQRLKIEELRSRYGGSSHSMREALTLLSTEGLVEANAQRGFRVSSATEADLIDINRLRGEIERLGLAWSMQHGDVSWEGQVIAAHHTLSRARENVIADPLDAALAWDEAKRAFHIALMAASNSPRLIAMQVQLYDQSRRFRLAALREGRIDFTAAAANHVRLLDAILKRDADAALACLHIDIEGNLIGADAPGAPSQN